MYRERSLYYVLALLKVDEKARVGHSCVSEAAGCLDDGLSCRWSGQRKLLLQENRDDPSTEALEDDMRRLAAGLGGGSDQERARHGVRWS